MSDHLVSAVADGHDVSMHECLLRYVRDGQTHFRVSYGTTQHDSSSGTQPRNIVIACQVGRCGDPIWPGHEDSGATAEEKAGSFGQFINTLRECYAIMLRRLNRVNYV